MGTPVSSIFIKNESKAYLEEGESPSFGKVLERIIIFTLSLRGLEIIAHVCASLTGLRNSEHPVIQVRALRRNRRAMMF